MKRFIASINGAFEIFRFFVHTYHVIMQCRLLLVCLTTQLTLVWTYRSMCKHVRIQGCPGCGYNFAHWFGAGITFIIRIVLCMSMAIQCFRIIIRFIALITWKTSLTIIFWPSNQIMNLNMCIIYACVLKYSIAAGDGT